MKKNYNTLQNTSEGWKVLQVQGYAALIDDLSFFVYKRTDGFWSVTDMTTGSTAGLAKTRKGAIKIASDRISEAGYEKCTELRKNLLSWLVSHNIIDGELNQPYKEM